MATKKKTTLKGERISNPFKDSMAEALMREALFLAPELTQTQLRRVFSRGYQALRGDKGAVTMAYAREAAKRKGKGCSND